jgi:hypothetical protein
MISNKQGAEVAAKSGFVLPMKLSMDSHVIIPIFETDRDYSWR